MIRADLLIFGYRVFCFKNDDVKTVADLLLKHGVSAKFKGNSFVAGEKKAKKIEELLSTRVEFSKSNMRGFAGFLAKHRKRWGVFSALMITVALFLFTCNRVWDVRVEGCDDERCDVIISELEKSGFKIGKRWSDMSLSRVEVDFLSISDTASWININRRGLVAYVTVIEKNTHTEPDKKTGYANIVASCDAVIEEITVMRGVAAVKAGDSVKRGDLLISGIISNEFGTEFCYAEGDIVGRISDSVSVTVPNFEVNTSEKERRLSNLTLKFFNFSINIYNTTRNCSKECGIIEEIYVPTVLGTKLPLAIRKQYSVEYELITKRLSSAEMSTRASEKMAKELSEKLAGATLLRISTSSAFSADSYTITANTVYLEKIGNDNRFEMLAN